MKSTVQVSRNCLLHTACEGSSMYPIQSLSLSLYLYVHSACEGPLCTQYSPCLCLSICMSTLPVKVLYVPNTVPVSVSVSLYVHTACEGPLCTQYSPCLCLCLSICMSTLPVKVLYVPNTVPFSVSLYVQSACEGSSMYPIQSLSLSLYLYVHTACEGPLCTQYSPCLCLCLSICMSTLPVKVLSSMYPILYVQSLSLSLSLYLYVHTACEGPLCTQYSPCLCLSICMSACEGPLSVCPHCL